MTSLIKYWKKTEKVIGLKKLGFGLMRLPRLDENDSGSIDIKQVEQMVDTFLERGFTYFDTAWMYCGGKSEETAGKALVARHPRDSFTLTTKLPAYMLHTEEDREKIFSEQLRRTGAGYFDYYWLHDVNRDTLETFEALHCFEFISQKKKEGLVRHVGFSFHDGPELLDQVLTAHPEMEYVQLQLNYLDWDSLGVQSHACYDVATAHKKPVIVMEPVKGGTLANLPEEAEQLLKNASPESSIPSWAIRFAATRENVMMVLSGMSNMEQLLDNTGYMQQFVPLTKEEDELVLKAAEIINKDIAIACEVSIATVSKALNDHSDIGKATKEYIKQTAKEMGYFPNSAAKALKTNKSYNIGVLFADEAGSGLKHDYFTEVLDSFKRAVEEKELTQAVERFLRKLPQREAQVFVCRYWYLDSVAQISRRFHFSESKVKSMLLRLRKRLKSQLEREGYFDEK